MSRIVVRVVAVAALLIAASAVAQTQPPEIANGAAWLSGQIQADGSLAGEAGSIALPLQGEAETASTFSLLGMVPGSVVARVDANTDALTEYRARRVIALAAAGQNASAPLAELMSLRNADGGFGAAAGYSSNPLDTAFALYAMARGGSVDTPVAAAALGYLLSVKHADGSWGIAEQGSVHVTAQVLLAAQAWSTRLAVAPISSPAHDWLLGQRNGELRFTDTLDNAMALLALATQTAQADVLQPLADGLRTAQLADGSWNADAYLTAVALRALWSMTNAPPQPSTGVVAGRVVDADSGLPIEGATVQRTDDPAAAVASSSDGSFTLSSLAPGSFRVRISRVGYAMLELDITIAAGQTLQLGTVQLAASPLTANLTGVVRTNAGAALAGAIVSVGTASILTDAAGAYALNALDAGAATIQVAKSGYRTVTAEVTFLAGQHYSFSPTLYPNNTTPPTTATLRGGVIDSTNGQPIAGAIVEVGGATATTAANGRFELAGLAVGVFTLDIHAGGYQAVTATGTLANGVNDIGNVPLAAVPATSTISGLVSDADGGAAIVGASLVVEGQSATAVSGTDGRYVLTGVQGTQFTLLVTAPGYLSGRFDVNLPQPGSGTLDLQLVAAQASGLLIDEVRTNKPVYAPSEEIELEVEVNNTTDAAAEMVIDADVRDPQGNIVYVFKANVHGAGQYPPNLPLTFAPASMTEVEMEWAAQRLIAGSYTVHVRGSDVNGRVLTEGSAQFTVRSEPALRGGVTPNPPLAQAGTSVPVHLTADLLNVGNVSVPAGELKLSIVLQNADNDTSTVPQASVTTLLSGTPFANPRGGMVRDSAGNLFTVNNNDRKLLKLDVQTLAVSVLATVPDAPSGVAIDADDMIWVASTAKRISSVDTSGTVTSFNAARITSLTGIDVDAAGNLVLSGRFSGTEGGVAVDEHRLVRRALDGIETVLWRNGLSQPIAMVKDDAGNFIVSNYGDNTLARVSPQGAITPFAHGLNRPYGLTRDAAGNLYVANSGDGTIAKVTSAGEVSTWASGFLQPMDLRFDAAGDLFVSNQGDDSIIRITPDGQRHVFARGIANQPEGMKYDAAGNLYIANTDGTLRRKNPDGSVQTLATGLSGPRGLALRDDDAVLVANFNDGTVAKVDGTDKSVFASGLANPYGVAVDDQGRAHVTERGAHRIRSFDDAGSAVGAVESLLVNPGELHVDAQGRVFVLNTGFITVIENGTPRVLVANFAAGTIAVDPVNGGLLALRSRDLYRIGLDGTMTLLATLAFTPYDAVVNAAGEAIVRDYSGQRLYKVDATGVPVIFAQLTQYPVDLTADLAGTVYVQLNDRSIHKVEADGTLTPVMHTLTEYIYGISADATGALLVWTNYSRVNAIDPVTGTFMRLKEGVSPSGLTRDANGQLSLSFSSSQEVDTYDGTGAVVARLDGFVNPWDILWDGTALRFVDNGGRFYSLAPGGYPVKQGTFNVYHLAQAGADILGSDTSGRIVRWTGTAAAMHAGVTGARLNGVAGRADGRFAGSDTAVSRVVEFDAARQVIADHAGIVRPQGLAFDAQGRLHVANYGAGTVARLDANGIASLVTAVASPRYLAFDADANLWITRSGGVTRVTPTGVAAAIGSAVNMMGVLIDGSAAYAVDQTWSQLRRLDGTGWLAFASGLSNPTAVRAGAGDVVYVANRNSNAVLAYSADQLSTVAVNLAGIDTLALADDGALYVGRDSGLVDRIEADGSVNDLHVRNALGQMAVYGLVEASASQLYAMAGAGTLYGIAITQAPTPPVPGTVVYSISVPMVAMPPSEIHTHFDFGDWQPPYGGDFQVVVERESINAPVVNYVHVGPHATGVLTAALSELPPGDQTLPMCLNLSGADFTSISRVEVDQVRRLASISRPNGMAADRAGNVYYTNGTTLYRTDVQGVATTVLTGLTTAFGLATDSNENLYFANRNGTTGKYELLRVDPAGTRSTVADLGVTRANGVAVNSHEEILVGSPGKLFKVTQAGAVSVVTTSGLPNPRGIAIDGRDNVYVQNDPGYVSLIKPDGSVSDLYSSNNGIEDPYFEGDGYPNIAADCADNLYVASFQWNRMGVAASEEHMIAQIVPRTGHAAVLFDTLNVNSIINDIDYLAFDRFGSRLMMYNDYEQMIWQVPVTCGAIGVDAHIMTVPGQSLTAMTKAPAAVVVQADGRTEYVWSLRDVSADGASVCFDTELKDLDLGELRKSVDSGFITFRNSFSPQDVTLPLEVPLIQVSNLVSLAVATDQAEYPANSSAQITSTLDNANAVTASGVLTVEVFDTQGVLVGRVQQQDVNIPPGTQLPVSGEFAIGTILPGSYSVRSVLSDNGRALAQAESSFAVLPDDAQGLARTQLSTDKQLYQPSDQVQIASRVTSLSANVILDNLTLMVQVFDAADTLLFTQGHPIAQLLPGASKDFVSTQLLQNVPAGTCTVRQVLSDAAAHVLDTREVSYQVGSSGDNGFGLVGALSADPVEVSAGEVVQLSGSATNSGNADLSAVPLQLALIDPEHETVLWTWDTVADIAMAATVPLVQPWNVETTPVGVYVAVLKASVGGQERVLAQTTFNVVEQPVTLDASITLTANPVLSALVLVDADMPPADRDRVHAALATTGYAGTLVETAADFDAALRSGTFQLYLLLGDETPLAAESERLLREAVHRGEGLLVANGGGALSETIAQIAGLARSNALTPIPADAVSIEATAPGGPAQVSLDPPVPSRIVDAAGADVLAELEGRFGNAADIRPLAEAVAAELRIDIGYAGSDAGANGSHLDLFAPGRLRNDDGSDRYTVWQVRNSGDNARTLELRSSDGSWSIALLSAAHTDAFIASPVVAGDAAHGLFENDELIRTQSAPATLFADQRPVDVGANPGAIALWANAVDAGYALEWSGSQHKSYGAVHSNSGIRWSGSQNLVDGPVHYVDDFRNSGSQNTFTVTPRVVTPQPLPQLLDIDDYRPGGPVQAAMGSAYLDQSAECARKGKWKRNGSSITLASGIYWIPCDVQLSGSRFSGQVTLVSTGSFQLSGSSANFQPFHQGVQIATSQAGAQAVKLSTSSLTLGGLVYAPNGEIQASGSFSQFGCSLVADTIRLSGSKITIDARQCGYAAIQRRAPAVTWNAFGAGWTGYAAFDWSTLLAQAEPSGSGPMSQLFEGVLNRLAPDTLVLRAGSLVPIALNVQNHADVFQGNLQLEAQGDASVIVPGVPQWLLDFSQSTSFDATAVVQLGSGSSTTLNARAAAVTPIVVDPLSTASLSIDQLPGEALATLIADLVVLGDRDAALDAALALLQAAEAALAAGDRESAVASLLDAAESAGRSTQAQASAYRTRIDWVLWRESR